MEIARADWLDSLEPGDSVVLVAAEGRSVAMVGTCDVDQIDIVVFSWPCQWETQVWRDTGISRDGNLYICPADGPLLDPRPDLELDRAAW